MIIDCTYFNGAIAIEGLNSYLGSDSITNVAVQEMANDYISMYENEYLEKMFGEDMCRDIIEAFESVSSEKEMSCLLALLRDEEKKKSPIANYVFYHLVARNGVSASSLGAAKQASDKVVSPNSLIVPAWNRMVFFNKKIDCYVSDNSGYFRNYKRNCDMLEMINELGI